MYLMSKCVTNSNREQVYKTKGALVLTNLVRGFFTQLYALHCLSWFTLSYSKMRERRYKIVFESQCTRKFYRFCTTCRTEMKR